MSDYHTSVLLNETIEGLSITPGKKYIDATLGGGGHSLEIVKKGGVLLSIDTDKEAITQGEELRTQNSVTNKDWEIAQGNFRNIAEIAKENNFERVDGILFDLGVSSHQLDEATRGFSYRFGDAPLDLRLNQNEGESAAAYLKSVSENQLYETLATYGEEERARKIASHIVRARSVKDIETTGALLDVIIETVGEGQSKPTASRVFQALRIVVNDEMSALKEGLVGAKELLAPGGRLVVISFHSLEDRIIKQFMRTSGWKLVTKKPTVASDEENYLNRRARSAKLRVAEKI